METTAISSATTSTAATTSSTADALTGDDFLKLLITQLSNQDPLEPTSTQELLEQLASIRDIEASTNITDTLDSLLGQQRYASASGLIGNYAVGRQDAADSTAVRTEGIVVGVRFSEDGQPFLQLEGGQELALDHVESVLSSEQAAYSLIGKLVTGVDRSGVEDPQVVEGIVTGVTTASDGSIVLELDTGETLELSNVVSASSVDATGSDGTSL